MNRPVISFIIPVYNVEKYIEKCILSVMNQKISFNVEIVIVDDGSTDSSGSICDRYIGENIIIIHKENGGLASARNKGLEHATGQYIAFLDSDDYINDGCLEQIGKKIEELHFPDMILMRGIKIYPDGRTELIDQIDSHYINGKSKINALRYLSRQKKYPGSSCTKLFKKSFLETSNIWFPNDKRIGEDLPFVMDCFLKAKELAAIDVDYYFYRQFRIGSITNNSDYKSFAGRKRFIEEYSEKLAKKHEAKDKISAYCLSFVAYEYCLAVWQYNSLNKSNKLEEKIFLESFKWLSKFAKSTKIKGVFFISSIIGFSNTSYLIGKIKRD